MLGDPLSILARGAQKLCLDLSYRLYVPSDYGQAAHLHPIVLFLHGIGEAYADDPPGGAVRIGHDNLLRHGPPKLLDAVGLATLMPEHPLRTSFVVVSPQLPDRATPWGDARVVASLAALIDRLRASRDQRVFLMGFSKGGRGVFELAAALAPETFAALVPLDAAPLETTPNQAFDRWARPCLDRGQPTWAFYTHSFPAIVAFNERIRDHGLPDDPQTGEAPTAIQICSFRSAPAGAEPHAWICEQASRDTRLYRWLLAR